MITLWRIGTLLKSQWVMLCKDRSFNLGETTNNRIESTFRHVKNVCIKHASLMQFFNEFLSVLITFWNQRNHSYLMALYWKSTKLEGLNSALQQYHEYATPSQLRIICIYQTPVGIKQSTLYCYFSTQCNGLWLRVHPHGKHGTSMQTFV